MKFLTTTGLIAVTLGTFMVNGRNLMAEEPTEIDEASLHIEQTEQTDVPTEERVPIASLVVTGHGQPFWVSATEADLLIKRSSLVQASQKSLQAQPTCRLLDIYDYHVWVSGEETLSKLKRQLVDLQVHWLSPDSPCRHDYNVQFDFSVAHEEPSALYTYSYKDLQEACLWHETKVDYFPEIQHVSLSKNGATPGAYAVNVYALDDEGKREENSLHLSRVGYKHYVNKASSYRLDFFDMESHITTHL